MRGWAVVGMSGLALACSHVAASTAPLSARGEATPVASSLPAGAAPVASAKARPASDKSGGAGGAPAPSGGKSGKQGKRALFQRSCELGSALACNELAILQGEDWQKGLVLFQRACELGLTRGCANWGTQLLRKSDSTADHDHALQLLSRACDAADDFACEGLGDAYYDSQETLGESALRKAQSAYDRGCKLGSMAGCLSDGWMLRRGEGARRDPTRARELFRLVCEHENFEGCAALGYDLTDTANNSEEAAEGTRWLKLSCEHDQAFGCFSLGLRMLTSSEQPVQRDGLALLKRSCQLGLSSACSYARAVEERLARGGSPTAPGSAPDDGDEEDEEDVP